MLQSEVFVEHLDSFLIEGLRYELALEVFLIEFDPVLVLVLFLEVNESSPDQVLEFDFLKSAIVPAILVGLHLAFFN